MREGLKKIFLTTIIILVTTKVFAQEKIYISGVIDWEALEIRSDVSLDLASAKLKLPAGRNQAESFVAEGYTRLVRQGLLGLQIDSSSAVKDLVEKKELSLSDLDTLSSFSNSLPAALSPDMLNMSRSFTIPITLINNALQKHTRPSPVQTVLNPVSAANYTGIVIIASEKLPSHGLNTSYLPVPCLFPKIWDSDMNLVYERNMAMPGKTMVRYSANKNILANTPSGISKELQEIVGDKPLRIFARGVFGIKPTDLIIDKGDALLILSSNVNRYLLTQGKVAIILDESVLTEDFSY